MSIDRNEEDEVSEGGAKMWVLVTSSMQRPLCDCDVGLYRQSQLIVDSDLAIGESWKSDTHSLLFDHHSMSSKQKGAHAGSSLQATSICDEGSESSASSIEDDSADSSSSSDDAGEETIGMKVARQRVVKGTRSRYERCIRSMGRWMKDKGLVPSSLLRSFSIIWTTNVSSGAAIPITSK
jgi:hypothetical protein